MDIESFDEMRQSEPWKNQVAKELNALTARANFVEGDPYPEDLDREFVAATRSIVQRVAEFEEILTGARITETTDLTNRPKS